MNDIVIFDAKNRFSTLELGVGREQNRTEYRCVSCGEITVFTEKIFAKSLFNDYSVFNIKVRGEIEKVRPFVRGNWEEFLDFECKGCDKFVRLIFTPNEFRMGCQYYQLKEVVESS